MYLFKNYFLKFEKKILNFQKYKYNTGRLYFGEEFEHKLLCDFIILEVSVHVSTYNQGYSPTSPQTNETRRLTWIHCH